MWSNKYIGIPYKPRGRDQRGVDCWGLVRLVYAEQYGISLPSLVDSYTEDDHERIGELIDLYREGWESQETYQPGDVVLFRVMGEPTHVGVVVEDNRFIHSILNKNVAIENLTSLSWSKRIVGYYRYKTNTTGVAMNVAPHPLKTQRYTVPVPPGTTVEQLASWVTKEYGISDQLKTVTTILINGRVVDKDLWPITAVKEGDTLEYRAVPEGGEGFRMFLMVALAFAAPYLSGMLQGAIFSTSAGMALGSTALGSTLVVGVSNLAVGLIGSLLINAIAPIRPPEQKTPEEPGKIYLSTGSQNRLLPYEPIPVVLGKVRMTPPLGAENVSRYQNETDTYLDMLLIWGYGPLSIDETSLKIGDIPLNTYTDNLGNPTYRQDTINYIQTPPQQEIDNFNSIYGRDINQELVQLELTCEGSPEAQTELSGPWVKSSIALTEENPLPRSLELAIAFPQGLRRIKTKGKNAGEDYNNPVNFDLQWRHANRVYGSGLTLNITVSPGGSPSSATIVDGGQNYIVGDRISIGGGLGAQTYVSGVSAGAVTAITTISGGIYYTSGIKTTETISDYQALPPLKLGGQAWVDEEYQVTYGGEGAEYTETRTRKALGTDSIKKDGFVWYNTYSLPSITGGTVDVRIRRTTGDETTPEGSNYQYISQSVFQTAKIITNVAPTQDPPGCVIAKTALTIKSTNQLNGNLEGINALVQTYCLNWNGSDWVMAATSNPAALFRYVLTHPANPRKILPSEISTKIDLAQLQYWSVYCDTKGFEYNSIEAGGRSIMEVLRDICAAGRASPALVDGRWTVVIDEPRNVVVQHFTPHNSWGFESTKAIPQLPDAFRISYVDEDQGYQQLELVVPLYGKSHTTAQLFESIELPGVTSKTAAIDHARWHIAQIKLRPEIYTINTDIEYIVCNRGDRVKVTHDVPMWGLGSGRIKNIVNSQQVYDLDEQIFIEENKQYTIRVRSKTGGTITRTLDRQFNIIQAQKVAGGVKVTVNEPHSVVAGNFINVASTAEEIAGTNMLVVEVTDTTITYQKIGPYFNTGSYSGTVSLIDDNYTRVKFTTTSTTDEIDVGDLFLFGELNQESQDLIVLGIEPTDNKNARITFMDYGVTDSYNIFTDYLNYSNSIIFETGITLPPEGIRKMYTSNDKPKIADLTIYSGFETLNRLSPGIYEYSIKVSYINVDNITTKTSYVECQYDLANSISNNSAKIITVPFNQGSITIPGVREGFSYKIRLRYLSEDGVGGPWTAWHNHAVQGLLDSNNFPLTISVDRVTRFLEITPTIGDGTFIPDDFKTYEFKVYKDSGNPAEDFWNSTDGSIQTKYSGGPVRFNLREFSQPRLSLSGVQYRIACRVIDVTDRYISSSAISSVLITSLV